MRAHVLLRGDERQGDCRRPGGLRGHGKKSAQLRPQGHQDRGGQLRRPGRQALRPGSAALPGLHSQAGCPGQRPDRRPEQRLCPGGSVGQRLHPCRRYGGRRRWRRPGPRRQRRQPRSCVPVPFPGESRQRRSSRPPPHRQRRRLRRRPPGPSRAGSRGALASSGGGGHRPGGPAPAGI